jgi:hypothetical protein
VNPKTESLRKWRRRSIMKLSKKFKKSLTLYNIAIISCVVIIVVSLVIVFMPEKKEKIMLDGVEVIQSNTKEGSEISEDNAKKLAIKQFKKLGENDLSENDVSCLKILRDEDEYFYIKSKQNTLEIKVKGGQISRINSVPVK